MTITFDIREGTSLTKERYASIDVTSLNATAEQMPFVAQLTDAAKEFTSKFTTKDK